MSAQPRDLRQCRQCGAVTGEIWTGSRLVQVDLNPVMIYENRTGEDSGFTLDGRFIKGDIVPSHGPCGAWEVFQEHRCPQSKPGAVRRNGTEG